VSKPMEQEARSGHKLVDLGYDVHLEVSEFKGKAYASVRRWFQADDNKWYRTKNGLNMKAEEMLTIIAALQDAEAFIVAEMEQPFKEQKEY